MSNSKLDAAKAARYWGCEVICPDEELYKLDGRILSAIERGAECILLLTPLSAITDEHAIEVAKVARPEITDYNHLLNIGWGIISVIKDGYVLPELGFKSITAILRELCEFGYDCDNAISEGWAVDKTTFDNK